MEFIKTFTIVHGHGKKPELGTLVISEGKLKIKINDNKVHIKQIGRTAEGVGVVVEADDVSRKTSRITSIFQYHPEDIPENFQGEGYRFSIPATRISNTEYEFKFCNAKMLNKK